MVLAVEKERVMARKKYHVFMHEEALYRLKKRVIGFKSFKRVRGNSCPGFTLNI